MSDNGTVELSDELATLNRLVGEQQRRLEALEREGVAPNGGTNRRQALKLAAAAVVGAAGVAALKPEVAQAAAQTVILRLLSKTYTASGATGPLPNTSTYLFVGVNLTAGVGTSTTVWFYVETLGADGVWYRLAAEGLSLSTAPLAQWVTTIGPGCFSPFLATNAVRFRWELNPGVTSATFSASIVGG